MKTKPTLNLNKLHKKNAKAAKTYTLSLELLADKLEKGTRADKLDAQEIRDFLEELEEWEEWEENQFQPCTFKINQTGKNGFYLEDDEQDDKTFQTMGGALAFIRKLERWDREDGEKGITYGIVRVKL